MAEMKRASLERLGNKMSTHQINEVWENQEILQADEDFDEEPKVFCVAY